MRAIEKIAKIIAAVILVPTVLLVAFILLVEITGADLNTMLQRHELAQSYENETESVPLPQEEAGADVSDYRKNDSQETAEPGKTGGMTEEKYERIQNDMSYSELVDLIGCEGILAAESENAGVKTTMYEWTADDGWGTAIVVLQDDKVINKSQTGITDTVQTAVITIQQYEQIEEGMTYEKVVEIIGGEGEAISESNTEEAVTVVYMWEGSDGISNAIITFFNDVVFSKAQTGLQ